MKTPLPQLVPVKAKWQIESLSGLDLRVGEGEPLVIGVNVFLLNEQSETPDREGYRIAILFRNYGSVRYNEGPFEGRAVDPELYDWSLVPGSNDDYESFDDWFENYYLKQWELLGECPNPGMYEVENSHWLTEEDRTLGFKHYLILGESRNIELIGAGWAWEIKYKHKY